MLDVAYEDLDKGVWSKYDNWKSFSPFYKLNAREEYEKVIEGSGFKNYIVEKQPSSDCCVTFTEDELEGKVWQNKFPIFKIKLLQIIIK